MTLLSALRVRDISYRIQELAGRGGRCACAHELCDNTSVGGTEPKVFSGYIVRTSSSPSLYYDFLMTVTGGDATVRVKYKDLGTVTITAPVGSNYRLRGVTTPPAYVGSKPAVIPVTVTVQSAAGGTAQAALYWLDEYAAPSGYTAMSSSTALTVGESTSVPADLALVEANLDALETLSNQRAVPGFRCYQFYEAGEKVWRLKVGGTDGYLYLLFGAMVLKGSPSAYATVKVYVNTTNLVYEHTLDQNMGKSTTGVVEEYALWDAACDLSSVTPAVVPQTIIRVNLQLQTYGDIAVRLVVLRVDWLSADVDLPTLPFPMAGQTTGSLRALYDGVKALADDDGTGYAGGHYNPAGGYPVGYALADGRSGAGYGERYAVTGELMHPVEWQNRQVQMMTLRHTGAPNLYVVGKRVDVVTGWQDDERIIASVEDASEGVLIELSEMPLGTVYAVRSEVDFWDNETPYLGYAAEVWS